MESFRSAIATCSVMSPAPRPWTRIQQQGDTRQTRSSSVLNGIVLVSHINSLRQQKREMSAAIRDGSSDRLRPVLTTALVASLGFIPMAVSTATGAETQQELPS